MTGFPPSEAPRTRTRRCTYSPDESAQPCHPRWTLDFGHWLAYIAGHYIYLGYNLLLLSIEINAVAISFYSVSPDMVAYPECLG